MRDETYDYPGVRIGPSKALGKTLAFLGVIAFGAAADYVLVVAVRAIIRAIF